MIEHFYNTYRLPIDKYNLITASAWAEGKYIFETNVMENNGFTVNYVIIRFIDNKKNNRKAIYHFMISVLWLINKIRKTIKLRYFIIFSILSRRGNGGRGG